MADRPPKKGRPANSGGFTWRAFFQESTTPVFVLGKGRRLRFANAAWEKLTGLKLVDALGMVCSARRYSTPLAHALAPTPEAQAGRPDTARRPAPPGRHGPPWWDVAFQPLSGESGLFGVVGFIRVVGEAVPAPVRKLPAWVADLRDKHAAHFTPDRFAGAAHAGERFQTQLRHAAASEAPVWLVGEPGSGKETAARVIHHAGPRRNLAFVGIDCLGLQPYLVESLLFGHGGLIASGGVGTVYLKHPASLPRDHQQRLADVFGADVPGGPRLMSGSTRSAVEEVAAGELVADFHTALSVVELRVPPLRDRFADLPRFAAHFLPGVAVEGPAFDVLRTQAWPGNLRELADVLGEAAAASGGPVKAEHLPRELRVRAGIPPKAAGPRPLTLDPILEAVEKRLIALAMRKTGDHQTKAAEMLGIFRARLSRRLEALGFGLEEKT